MNKQKPNTISILILLLVTFTCFCQKKDNSLNQNTTVQPWTRWWWMGNVVDKENIADLLVQFKNVGLGGVEIEPIYGIQGKDAEEIEYLTPKWVSLLKHTIKIADSLGLGVDLTLGTGWPYGGPQVEVPFAATRLITETYSIKRGDEALLELFPKKEKDRINSRLLYVLDFGKKSGFTDLTPTLDNTSRLHFKAKEQDHTIYLVFEGKTGQMVKRAAPGGAGFTLDHYSNAALNDYVVPFQEMLQGLKQKPRAIFNDSYEVYGTDFTPGFFGEFKSRRGYELKKQFHLLMDSTDNDLANRVKSDYRETLSDLLLEEFDRPLTQWANKLGMGTRLQAHGSPGNLLDLYASANIPECETFGSMPYDIPQFRRLPENIRKGDADPVMLKFSSSAGHLVNRPLISSETFTWLRDHFKTALAHCKPEVEDLFLNGVNHVFLHGSTYSPKEAPWPGYKFYASVNFNPTNSIWDHSDALFHYIAQCQSLLQRGNSDNEILLYWPIHDVWKKQLDNQLFFQFKIHSLKEWLYGTSFYDIAQLLAKTGYATDFISDRFVEQAYVENGKIVLPGAKYSSLVVPDSKTMPLKTLKKLISLQKEGGIIIFLGLPESVPGFKDHRARAKKMQDIIKSNSLLQKVAKDPRIALESSSIYPEELVETGLKFIRRAHLDSKIYYLVNHSSKDIDTVIPLNTNFSTVTLYDPQGDIRGRALPKKSFNGTLGVRVQISSGKSLFVITNDPKEHPLWAYLKKGEERIVLEPNWKLEFIKGGPSLPGAMTLEKLQSWTNLGPDATNFSGTARYTSTFTNTIDSSNPWLLELGDVRESAKVWLNGEFVGTAWYVPFALKVPKLKIGKNTLIIEVANLPANRIRAKELRGEEWKIFKEINMVNKDYKTFDATQWNPVPSGLLGPINLTPLDTKN
jgi:hypothetical protein